MNPFENLPGAPSSGGTGRSGRRLLRSLLPALALLLAAGCDFSPITNVGTEVEGLTGTLVTESGRPASGAWVRVHPVSPTMLSRAATTSITTSATDSMRTSATGTFQFKDLPDGLYNLSASVRRGDTTLALFLTSLRIVGDTNIGTDTLYRSGTIILQARADGSSVPGAQCEIGDSPWLTVSDAAGICILQGVAPGVYRISVSHPSYLKTLTTDIMVVSADSTGTAAVDLVDTNEILLPPGVPTLVSPVGNAEVDPSASLSWTGAGGWTGARYIERQIIEVALDSLFQNIAMRDTMVLNATISSGGTLGRGGFMLAPGKTYWWRVTLRNAAGSATSLSARFRTSTGIVASILPRLVAHWDFNEASGAMALDASGNGRTGMIVGPAVRVTGIQGGALQFNGTTFVEIADSAIPPLESFSLTAWVRETSQAKDQPVFDFCCTDSRVGLHLWTNTVGSSSIVPGKVYVNLRANPPQNNLLYTTANPLTVGSWNHVALTYDGTSRRAVIYVNGVARDSTTLPAGQKPTVSGMLLLGRRSPSTTDLQAGTYFTGMLDDVRIYEGALTSSQVNALQSFMGVPFGGDATYLASADVTISSAIPSLPDNNNLGALNRGKETLIGPGTYEPYTTSRTLIRFDLPVGVTAASVGSAIIRVTTSRWVSRDVNSAYTITLHRMLKSWKEGSGSLTANSAAIDGATALERFWGDQNGSEDWATRLGGPNDIDAVVSPAATLTKNFGATETWDFDVTDLVRAWAADPTTNFGVMMASAFPGQSGPFPGYPEFHAREAGVPAESKPLLIITSATLALPANENALSIAASQDAGILAPAPSQTTPVGTHGNSNFGKLSNFGVGAYDVNTVARALVRFAMPQGVPGSRITKAVIRLNTSEWITKNVRRDTVRLDAHRVLRDWKEGVGATQEGSQNSASVDGVTGLERFWGTQDGNEDWSQKLMGLNGIDAQALPAASASRPRAFIGVWEFDVTALARSWADNPGTNYGVVFTTDIPASNNEVWDYPVFHSRESTAADALKPRLELSLAAQTM